MEDVDQELIVDSSPIRLTFRKRGLPRTGGVGWTEGAALIEEVVRIVDKKRFTLSGWNVEKASERSRIRRSEQMARRSDVLPIFSASSYKVSYRKAKATNTCILCGGLARDFRDPLTRLEYEVSALCQKCQDEYLRRRKSTA